MEKYVCQKIEKPDKTNSSGWQIYLGKFRRKNGEVWRKFVGFSTKTECRNFVKRYEMGKKKI